MAASAIAAFLGGIGAGSVMTAVVQHYLGRRAQSSDALRKDRTEVYGGLLQALATLEAVDSQPNAKQFGMWMARVDIIGSPEVVAAVSAMRATEPNSSNRGHTFKELLVCMRKDLYPK